MTWYFVLWLFAADGMETRAVRSFSTEAACEVGREALRLEPLREGEGRIYTSCATVAQAQRRD